jgi:lysozyme
MARALNQASIDLIKHHEGLRLKAYPDPGSGGEPWTIGYGHTSAAGLPKVYPGLKITAKQAEDILRADLATFAAHVESRVTVPINDNQFGVLVSFCFNVGPANFDKSSVIRHVNAEAFSTVPARLELWNKASGRVMAGLTKRRKDEGELFLKPVAAPADGQKPTPAPNPQQNPFMAFLAALFGVVARLFTKGK